MGNSRFASDDVLYSMDDTLREKLGENIGILAGTKEEVRRNLIEGNFLVTVGDVVTLDLLESGIVPDLSLVDYQTKRMPMAMVEVKFMRHKQPIVEIVNPPATITRAMWDAISDGYGNPRKLRIVVRGEEDLAALACIALAPKNTTVIYGIPGKGASVNHVDGKMKRLAMAILEAMKAR